MTKTRTAIASQAWATSVQTDISRPLKYAIYILCGGIISGGIWAATAPISGSAIAPGVVIVSGHNKTVQHLEGGIIAEVLIREGDAVKANQVLVKLDRTQAEANLARLKTQYRALRTLEARLTSERDGKDEFIPPSDLEPDPDSNELISNQQREFKSRRDGFVASEIALQKQLDAMDEQRNSLTSQLSSAIEQRRLIDIESEDVKSLFEKGLASKSRMLALQRASAQLLGVIGDLQAKLAQNSTDRLGAENRLTAFRQEWQTKVLSELRDTQNLLADANARLTAATDIDSRISIRSPVDGTVAKLYQLSPSGVLQAGQPVADIVPEGSPLQIEAHIKPDDIDDVTINDPVELRLSAIHSRATPNVPAKLTFVSPDRTYDQRSQASFFVARVDVDPTLLEHENIKLMLGMPVEVFIQTKHRTFMQYLLSPIMDVVERSFREP